MITLKKIKMNKYRVVLISIGILYLCTFLSCKKDSSSPAAHVITYKLSSSNYSVFNNVSYTDSVGVQTIASAIDSISGWSKTIKESYSSFPATLQVQGQNISSNQLTYTLEIIIDGVSAAQKQESINSFSSFNTQISATAQ